MSKIELCIFDLDGVIVDTAKYHYLAWKRLCKELGFDFSEKQNELLKGVSRKKSLEILLNIGKVSLSEEEFNDYMAKKNEWYLEMVKLMPNTDILPGVKDLLIELRENNIKVCLGSASKNALIILEKLDIVDLFDGIIDGNKVTNAKPDPEVFLSGARLLNIDPINCIVFEDALAGVEAAKRANMFAIGIGESENLPNADIVFSGISDLNLDILKEIFGG